MMSAGEAMGDAVFAYCQTPAGRDAQRDVWPNRDQLHRGQLRPSTSGTCPRKPGSMGRGYPGHRVAVIDEAGA